MARSTFARSEHFEISKKWMPLWREAHFEAKIYKTHHARITFGSCDVEKVRAVVVRNRFANGKKLKPPHIRSTFGSWDVKKVHAIVARSTFRSQNIQSTPCSDHFWKLRCRKNARRCGAKHICKWKKIKHTSCSEYFWKLRCRKSVCRCGAKHISKSKYTKHTIFGPLLEVEMSKKYTPLWREAHFEVKIYKAHHGRTTFRSYDVEKVHAVVARSTFRNQNNKIISGVRTTFGRSNVVSRGRRKELWILSKVRKMSGFVVFPKTMGVVGYLKKIYKEVFSVAYAVQETCSSKLLGGPGTNFLKGLLK